MGQPTVDAEHPAEGRAAAVGRRHRPGASALARATAPPWENPPSTIGPAASPASTAATMRPHLADRGHAAGPRRVRRRRWRTRRARRPARAAPAVEDVPAGVVGRDHLATPGWVLVAVQASRAGVPRPVSPPLGRSRRARRDGVGPHGPGRGPTLTDAGRDAEPAQPGAGHHQARMLGCQLRSARPWTRSRWPTVNWGRARGQRVTRVAAGVPPDPWWWPDRR